MLEFNAADFFRVTTGIAHTTTAIQTARKHSVEQHPDGSVTITPIEDPVFLDILTGRCAELADSLKVLGARITIMAVDEMDRHLRSGHATYEGIASYTIDIQRTLTRELTGVSLLAFTSKERDWYAPREPIFGSAFAAKFPTQGAFELDETAKCMALGRPTAAVFHLMRLMEVGIKTIAECLNIPTPTKDADRNWGKILGKIKDELDRRNASNAPIRVAHGDKEFFAGAYVSLDAVRVAWRNTTMHVENKYTDDEAEHVFLAVKGFMKALASRMDENGEPKA